MLRRMESTRSPHPTPSESARLTIFSRALTVANSKNGSNAKRASIAFVVSCKPKLELCSHVYDWRVGNACIESLVGLECCRFAPMLSSISRQFFRVTLSVSRRDVRAHYLRSYDRPVHSLSRASSHGGAHNTKR